MMRVKAHHCSLLFLCLTTLVLVNDGQGAALNNNDLYWLSYKVGNQGTFLMQIDSTGKVVRAPKLVLKVEANFFELSTTISLNGTDKINLWNDKQRTVIHEQNLDVLKTVKTTFGRPDSVTRKTEENFAVIGDHLSLKFFGVSRTGVPSGATWKVSSTDKGLCGAAVCLDGTVSSDGKTILWVTRELSSGLSFTYKLYIQPLLPTGRRDGGQKILGSEKVELTDADISNVLPAGHIYILYLLQNRQLILQAANAQTGQPIGEKILLREKPFGYYNNAIAIDPLGRFVVYFSQNKQNVGFLSFLALDATGHPLELSKVLVKKVEAYDVHLLKD